MVYKKHSANKTFYYYYYYSTLGNIHTHTDIQRDVDVSEIYGIFLCLKKHACYRIILNVDSILLLFVEMANFSEML